MELTAGQFMFYSGLGGAAFFVLAFAVSRPLFLAGRRKKREKIMDSAGNGR